jgi:ABC-2 type transport system ATP-binding protein
VNIAVSVERLSKNYKVPVRSAGLGASLRSLIKPNYDQVQAVRETSFELMVGEVVGLIGPNGAGKTTMLKMLSGLLYPSSGEAQVSGFTPWERRPDYLRRIAMVMGNKSQMLWDIPPLDTFDVLAEIYSLNPIQYRHTLGELVELLAMEPLLSKPVRNLSLGERMKCELVAALLHKPSILFLDEPTLGLDISMQSRLRRFLADYNRLHGVTMILTSHYMADVVALCPRVILIHQGRLLYDGELGELAQQLAPFKLIRLSIKNGVDLEAIKPGLPKNVDVIEQGNGRIVLRVGRLDAPQITAQLLTTMQVADLAVEDPPIEAVIDQIYSDGVSV